MLHEPEDPRDTFAVRQEADALSQDGAESDFEWLARLREHFADATALAEAEARGRRLGLEEAARIARAHAAAMEGNPPTTGERIAVYIAIDIETAMRRATAPAETEKPETGEAKP